MAVNLKRIGIAAASLAMAGGTVGLGTAVAGAQSTHPTARPATLTNSSTSTTKLSGSTSSTGSTTKKGTSSSSTGDKCTHSGTAPAHSSSGSATGSALYIGT